MGQYDRLLLSCLSLVEGAYLKNTEISYDCQGEIEKRLKCATCSYIFRNAGSLAVNLGCCPWGFSPQGFMSFS
jgi:hypothetical protein